MQDLLKKMDYFMFLWQEAGHATIIDRRTKHLPARQNRRRYDNAFTKDSG